MIVSLTRRISTVLKIVYAVKQSVVKSHQAIKTKLPRNASLVHTKSPWRHQNPDYHGRSKHISAKWHFIQRRVELGMVKLVDVGTEVVGADMMPKSVWPALLRVNIRAERDE